MSQDVTATVTATATLLFFLPMAQSMSIVSFTILSSLDHRHDQQG